MNCKGSICHHWEWISSAPKFTHPLPKGNLQYTRESINFSLPTLKYLRFTNKLNHLGFYSTSRCLGFKINWNYKRGMLLALWHNQFVTYIWFHRLRLAWWDIVREIRVDAYAVYHKEWFDHCFSYLLAWSTGLICKCFSSLFFGW